MAITSPARAEDDLAVQQQKLEELQQQVERLQANLSSGRQQQSEQQQALADTERRLGQVVSELRATEARLTEANQALAELAEEQSTLERQLAAQRDSIEALLRLAYQQNNQPLVKLLLSGQRPEDMARQMRYFAILNADQQAQLQQWLEQSERLAGVIEDQQRLARQLAQDQEQQRNQQAELTRQKNRREQIVANLNAEVRQTETALEQARAEQAQLDELVAAMEAELADLSLDFPAGEAINTARGRLPWPVEGRLKARFGGQMANSTLTWQGWLIDAAEGTVARAVHHGRVVFAEYLNGFGLLIILDHGDGMLTLYGRNQSLLRTVGEWVNAGDPIAEVGLSGGFSESGLYFEMRRNGQPENPANWLASR
ncbi:MAG: murein hydrolase activator EnvC family protein [Saccharospirillum sp.]